MIDVNYFNPFYKEKPLSFSTKAEYYYHDIACKIASITNQYSIFKNRFFVTGLKFSGGILCNFIFWKPLLPIIRRSIDSINPYLNMDIKVEKICRDLSLKNIFEVSVLAPLIEEFLFRRMLQENNFDKILKFITRKKTNPKLNRVDKILKFLMLKKPTNQISRSDKIIAKTVSVFITSALFGLAHVSNILYDSYNQQRVFRQVFYTFGLGLFIGVVNETKLGLPGAIGVHFANNASAIYRFRKYCKVHFSKS